MQNRAVIFDMDGVLLDSEPYYYDYLMSRFKELSLEVSDEEYDRFVGLPTRQVWGYLEKTKGIEIDIEALMKSEEHQVNEVFSNADLIPIHGIPELLSELDEAGIPMNIASSSARSTIEIIVRKLDLNGYFKFLLSGTEVGNGKPNPDIFLRSAEVHGFKPKDCLVIEDSSNGVKAAKSAGSYCVGFRNPGSGKQDLSDADIIIDDFGPENRMMILERLNS